MLLYKGLVQLCLSYKYAVIQGLVYSFARVINMLLYKVWYSFSRVINMLLYKGLVQLC